MQSPQPPVFTSAAEIARRHAPMHVSGTNANIRFWQLQMHEPWTRGHVYHHFALPLREELAVVDE